MTIKITRRAVVTTVLVCLGVFFTSFTLAQAVSVFITQQGGTGTTSPSGILYGDNGVTSHLNTVTIGSGITFTGGTLSSTNQNITLSGDVTGSGATAITTTYNGIVPSTKGGAGSISGLLKANGSGVVSAGSNGTDFTLITAKTCTAGDFVSAVTAAGVFTCTTPAAGSGTVTNVATDATLTGGPITTTGTLGLNLGNANTWTAKQTFNIGAGLPGIITNSLVGIGTTTPQWALQIASSTGAQLTLSDPSVLTNNHFSFRNAGGNFYLATSSPTTYATSTNSILSIIPGGVAGFVGISTSSPYAPLAIGGNVVIGAPTAGGTLGTLTLPAITSALHLADSTGKITAYTGASCTNQFVRAITAVGGATCATVANGDLANSTISGVALGGTLFAHSHDSTLSGTSYTGTAAVSDWGLNLGNANTWTAVQTFNAGAGVAGILSNALVGIGTTTPKWALTISSSTGPQLTLTDTSLTNAPFNFRSVGGNFYLSTSSPTTFATSTNSSILSIINGGISGLLGIGTTSPWASFSINSSPNVWPFSIGSSTGAYFGIGPYGQITASEYRESATSTAYTFDWLKSGPQTLYQTGVSATTITVINATTTLFNGSTRRMLICNPSASAGAITWVGVEWVAGTAPTQTATTNQCDLYSFFVSAASSTAASPTYKLFGAQSAGFN